MRQVRLPSGRSMPVLGMGTWRMGESARARNAEIAALRLGLDLGMTLIDTAEMYGEGGAERVIAEVIRGRREEVYLVSKVYPQNATERGAIAACERSLARLETDHLDLYLLHWRGKVPLAETFAGFRALRRAGKILDYGVSNFDVDDMEAAAKAPGGKEIATNQVLYNLEQRGIEHDLLPWCREHEVPITAYSPVAQGTLPKHPVLRRVASRHDATAAQVALAWLLGQRNVVTIPKATDERHVRENLATLGLKLAKDDLAELDRAFPPPRGRVPLEIN